MVKESEYSTPFLGNPIITSPEITQIYCDPNFGKRLSDEARRDIEEMERFQRTSLYRARGFILN